MAQTSYTAIELLQIGRENYDKLVGYCKILETEGFWEQARQVMKQSSTEVLDRYVQSVLMTLAVRCGELLDNQKEYIQLITDSNPLGIEAGMEVDEKTISDCERFTTFPPILMQLCGVYDQQFHANSGECFLDAFLNILLCMAYLNDGKDKEVNQFIRQYYEKIALFLNQAESCNHSEYLSRKLQSKRIACDIRWLHVDTWSLKQAKQKSKKKTNTDKKQHKISAGAVELQESPGDGENVEIQAEAEQEVLMEPDLPEESKQESQSEELAAEQPELETENAGKAKQSQGSRKTRKRKEPKKPQKEKQAKQPEADPEKKQSKESAEKKQDREKQEAEEKRARELREAEEKRIREQQEAEERRIRELKEAEAAKEQFQLVKKRLRDREEAEVREREARLQKLVDELDALVGLQGVKEEIQSLINLIRIRKLREQMKMPLMDMSYHMVFTGAPGTGKTTVARIVAKIYRELGILSKETVIETDRSGLVAGYVGQTALKVHELVEQAVGGVLFIDEAYALVNPDVPNDFGMEAVDTLVKLMEDHRDDLVIIVAGYTNEMKSFLKCNTGLVSRFNKFINFPDYSNQELLEILDVMASNAGLTVEQDAKEAIGYRLEQMNPEQKEEFGNARGIRNMFEKIVMNQANRLISQPHPTKEMLMTILKDDIVQV